MALIDQTTRTVITVTTGHRHVAQVQVFHSPTNSSSQHHQTSRPRERRSRQVKGFWPIKSQLKYIRYRVRATQVRLVQQIVALWASNFGRVTETSGPRTQHSLPVSPTTLGTGRVGTSPTPSSIRSSSLPSEDHLSRTNQQHLLDINTFKHFPFPFSSKNISWRFLLLPRGRIRLRYSLHTLFHTATVSRERGPISDLRVCSWQL